MEDREVWQGEVHIINLAGGKLCGEVGFVWSWVKRGFFGGV